MAAGSNCSRSTPLLGLAFLISAMTAASPRATLARIAAAKPRGAVWARASSCRSPALSLGRAAAISSRLTSTMRCRMSDIGLQLLGDRHELLELGLGQAGSHRFAGALDALGHGARHAG